MALALVSLLALCAVQLSLGSITELRTFRHEPDNIVEVTFSDHPPSSNTHQVSKRQTGGQPQVDVHQFHDGYRQGRVHYSGDNSDVIIVLTFDETNGIPYRSNLYRSTNYGKSFTDISGMVGNAILYQNFIARGRVLIFVDVSEPKLYHSEDEGATFNTVTFDITTLVPATVQYHPTRNDYMLMQALDFSLYVTTTYGDHWIKVADNVNFYQWGDANYDNDRTIFLAKIDSSNSDISLNLYTAIYPYTTPPEQFDPDLGDHDGFLVVGRYIFAQRTDENGMIGLYVSDGRKKFEQAQIPAPEAHLDYLVANINEAQALVIIRHAGNFYNLYLSDETGIYYSLSLTDLVIERNPLQIDLELIDGLNGTLIANQYTREDTSQRASSIRTVISLDNGGFWEGLLPPETDVNGDEVNCEPPSCSLHLHMDTTNYSRLGVYSTDSAPGIIVAHGNTGSELSSDPDLYISRDGGITWVETLAGSWGVNVADHGGLMVAAKDYHQQQSRTLMYSCNEGKNWTEFTFINFDITVFGVITEPGEHTTIVSLYGGLVQRGSNFEWIVVTVDFVNIFPRACENSDYYDWKPWDLRSETSCIMGSSITIERRLPEVCCLNSRNYVREFDYSICQCTSEDFECDYGFARPSFDLNAPCFRDNNIDLPNPCADGKTDTYTASSGYRKIAGDVCVDGEAYLFEPFEAPCCDNNTQPPTPNPHPQTHSHKGQEEGGSGVPMAAVVALGVILALAILTATVFMVACLFFLGKYKSTKHSYFRIMTAGEPDLSDNPEAAPQELPPVTDEDDKPLAL